MAAVVGGIRCCCYSRSRSAPIPLCWCLMPLTSTSAPNFNVDVNFASRRKSARLSQLYFGENLFGMDKNSPLLTRRYSSQHDDDCEFPSEGPISVTGGIVALGKFDALHVGHRQLAIQASKAGIPFLLSFVGMAEVLGWEARPPVVAKCDRKRVLSTWASYCGNVSPGEFHVQFSSVRHLSPREFVEKLANELKISGVVTGENYRFGYKAAGDASELVKLCEEYGMKAYIVGSVMDNKAHGSLLDSKDKGQVSSTRVRRALADGDINYVTELLGRNHRLVLVVSEEVSSESGRISVSKSCLLNLPPKEGLYDKCLCFIGDSRDGLPCTALIDSTRIHVESTIQNISFEHCHRIGIEFGCEY